MGHPDPKRGKRKRDSRISRDTIAREPWCVICEDARSQSAHHIVKRSQGGDDVLANTVGVCGDGVRGCHGRLEAREVNALRALGFYLLTERPDFLDYLEDFCGDGTRALAWFERNLAYVRRPGD
jgi:hypothetical protein